MKTLKVENNPDLIRDLGTGAILNTNVAKQQSKEKIESTNKRIDKLEDDLEDIKSLLKQLLEK